jgi:hypothetical protein
MSVLAGVTLGVRGAELRLGEAVLITVSPVIRGLNVSEVSGWYWSGLGKNTARTLKNTLEDAKVEADSHYKAWRAAQGNT